MSHARPGFGARRAWLALAVGAVAALAGALGLALALDDAFRHWYPAPRPRPAPVVVLGIDSTHPWPWHNARLADLLQRLHGAGVLGVGLDLPLVAETPDDASCDARLARALFDAGAVVGVTLVEKPDGTLRAQLPPVEFTDATGDLGHLLLPRDRDGRIRRHLPQAVDENGIPWPSLPLALLRRGSDAEAMHPFDACWQVAGAGGIPPTWNAADLVDGRIDPSPLRDHWVLVGLVDPALQPPLPGPHGSTPLFPVQHQARALAALLEGTTPRPLPTLVQALLALLLTGAATHAGLSRGGPGWRMPVALLAGIVAALSLSAALLARQYWFAPGATVGVLVLVLATWVATMLFRRWRLRRQLPGIATRRGLQAAAQAAAATAAPHALLLLQAEPHPAGDRRAGQACTRGVARLLQKRARRPEDVAAWLGGCRFALLLHGASAAAAGDILEQILGQASEHGLVLRGQIHACGVNDCTCLHHIAKKGPEGIAV